MLMPSAAHPISQRRTSECSMPEQSVCHATLGRRSLLAFGAETALLALLAIVTAPVSVKAVQIAPEDPRLKTGRVTVPNYAGGLKCSSARPAAQRGGRGGGVFL